MAALLMSPCHVRPTGAPRRCCTGSAVRAPVRSSIIARSHLSEPTVMAMSIALAPQPEAPAVTVQALAAESYHRFLEEAGNDVLTVVDFFTEWCGPCKLIAPELERMAHEYGYDKVHFAKINCGQDNESKRLAIALGIKALPTFHIYRGGKKQAEMTGAKAANLRSLIDKHL